MRVFFDFTKPIGFHDNVIHYCAQNYIKTIDITTSLNVGDEVADISPNIMNKLMEKLFAVCMAELTSIPFVFHVKNPKIMPETNISMSPKLLYP